MTIFATANKSITKSACFPPFIDTALSELETLKSPPKMVAD